MVGVFPACAGMFRPGRRMFRADFCFPRVCGDVPALGTTSIQIVGVFPACAGMFLTPVLPHPGVPRFPRVCGDVPALPAPDPAAWWFSPRVRGCSHAGQRVFLNVFVFPACAGMFLLAQGAGMISVGFPRVCGDVP